MVTAIQFEEVTEQSGVTFTYCSGGEAGEVAILESLRGGMELFRFDNAGDLDLCLPGNGRYGEKRSDRRDMPVHHHPQRADRANVRLPQR